MDQNELLLGIERMRSDSNYYAAEVMRRDVGGSEGLIGLEFDERGEGSSSAPHRHMGVRSRF